jgi:hypothetical protein
MSVCIGPAIRVRRQWFITIGSIGVDYLGAQPRAALLPLLGTWHRARIGQGDPHAQAAA